MRIQELFESRGTFTAEEAKEIGSCAVQAIATLTGLSWDEVWEAAKSRFGRHGMNSGDIWATLKDLGFTTSGYYKMPWHTPMSVKAAREWLQANDPDVRLICSINAQRIPHSIAFADGDFHNVLGAERAQLRLVYRIDRA